MHWRGHLSLPRDLALVKDGNRHVLLQRPAAELLAALRAVGRTGPIQPASIGPASTTLLRGMAYMANLTVSAAQEQSVKLAVRTGQGAPGASVTISQGTVTLDRDASLVGAPAPPGFATRMTTQLPLGDPVRVQVFVDRSSIEIFGGDGRQVLSAVMFPDPEDLDFTISAGGGARVLCLTVVSLEP